MLTAALSLPSTLGPVALILCAATFLLMLIETVVYLAHTRWYFGMGPSLHREVWQTGVSRDEAWRCIREGLPRLKWSWRDRGEFVSVRRRWTELSAWPRVTLRVLDSPQGAVVCYEVKPFVSMALFGAAIMVLMVSRIAPLRFQYFSAVTVLFIVLTYIMLWKREIRLFARLTAVRDALRPAGLHVCEACGYDLFGRAGTDACPECGAPTRRELAEADTIPAP